MYGLGFLRRRRHVDPKARLTHEIAKQIHQQVVNQWPEVHAEAEQLRVILQTNGFAPKIWEAMKERRQWTKP